MKASTKITYAVLAAFLLLWLLLPGPGTPGIWTDDKVEDKKEKPSISGPAKMAYPLLLWRRSFPEEIKGVVIARKSGQVAAHTMSKVYYFQEAKFKAPGDAAWTAGLGKSWKHIEGLNISQDGNMVLFQTDVKKKTGTEALNLTIHLMDGEGRVVWQKPNPYRYEKTLLSPSGQYIMIGDVFHADMKCHDHNLVALWQAEIPYWYMAFDPLERFIFDGEGGILYTIKGEQIWDFGPYTKILSVSDNAEYVMSKYYRSIKSAQRMFLMGRLVLKKIELAGSGGCISPDGSLSAYVNSEKKLVVYRTRELLEAGGPSIRPLFRTGFIKPWTIQISRDNRTLFVMGQEAALSSVMMLVNLEKMKTIWKRPVSENLRIALPTEDNREVVVKSGPTMLKKLRCY